jgi:hypothetical protein
MTRLVLVGSLVAALAVPGLVSAQAARGGQSTTSSSATSLGTVTLAKKVMADGQPLAAGTYQVRLTSDSPKPGIGQSADAERYVEFLKGGKVAGREVATIVPNADIDTVAKGKKPAAGSSKVELLKGNDYVRVWINHGGTHYIINMPPAS